MHKRLTKQSQAFLRIFINSESQEQSHCSVVEQLEIQDSGRQDAVDIPEVGNKHMLDFITKILKLGRYADNGQQRAEHAHNAISGIEVDGTAALNLDQAPSCDTQSQLTLATENVESEMLSHVLRDARLQRESRAHRADPELQYAQSENSASGLGSDHISTFITNSIKTKLVDGYIERNQQCIDAHVDQIPDSQFDCLPPTMDPDNGCFNLESNDAGVNPMLEERRLENLSCLIGDLRQLSLSLCDLARNCDEDLKAMLTECTTLPPEMFEILATVDDLDIRYGTAENYSCPLPILVRLAEDENPYVAHRAAKTLRRLYESGVQFPENTAQTEQEVDIRDIFKQPEPIKAEWQTMKLKETEELSDLFAVNEDSIGQTYARWLLNLAEAANTMSIEQSVSKEVIWMLIEDPNPDVRFALAENYNIDEKMLEALTKDENPYVCHRARKTLSRLRPAQVVDQDFRKKDRNVILHNLKTRNI